MLDLFAAHFLEIGGRCMYHLLGLLACGTTILLAPPRSKRFRPGRKAFPTPEPASLHRRRTQEFGGNGTCRQGPRRMFPDGGTHFYFQRVWACLQGVAPNTF